MSLKDEPRGHGPGPDEEGGPDQDEIQLLLRAAGPRRGIPPHLLGRIRSTAEDAWQDKVRTHRVARRRRLGAIAAVLGTVAMGLATVWWVLLGGLTSSSSDLATVVAAFHTDDSSAGELQAGDVLAAGSVVETASGQRLVLHLAGGQVVRLDEHSRLGLASAVELSLEGGAVYADAEPGSFGGLLISTPFGVVRDVGTRFEVRLLSDSLRVQVREGEVRLETPEEDFSATAGTALVLRDGRVQESQVDPAAAVWSWLLEAPEPFDLEGRSLQDFLAWAARETGKEVRFADPNLERRANGITTHGTIAGLSPLEAMDLVLPSSGLVYRSEGSAFHIERPAL